MPQDSQKVRVGPGGSYDYHYEINEEQPAGTYWYHPHHHGSNHFQVSVVLYQGPFPLVTIF